MLCGTPNVVTDVGDSALMVGASGWVVPPRDSRKLADAIGEAHKARSTQPEAWQQRRTAARQSIADRFTFDRMADAYAQIWRRLSGT